MCLFTLWLVNHLRDGVSIKTPSPSRLVPREDVLTIKPNMTVSNTSTYQMGQPLDHRHTNKRAHWQPRTNVSGTNRGPHVQSRTHVGNTNREKLTNKYLNVCTYNPQSISDLNREDLDVMLVELENMKWDVIGISASQIKNLL